MEKGGRYFVDKYSEMKEMLRLLETSHGIPNPEQYGLPEEYGLGYNDGYIYVDGKLQKKLN